MRDRDGAGRFLAGAGVSGLTGCNGAGDGSLFFTGSRFGGGIEAASPAERARRFGAGCRSGDCGADGYRTVSLDSSL